MVLTAKSRHIVSSESSRAVNLIFFSSSPRYPLPGSGTLVLWHLGDPSLTLVTTWSPLIRFTQCFELQGQSPTVLLAASVLPSFSQIETPHRTAEQRNRKCDRRLLHFSGMHLSVARVRTPPCCIQESQEGYRRRFVWFALCGLRTISTLPDRVHGRHT